MIIVVIVAVMMVVVVTDKIDMLTKIEQSQAMIVHVTGNHILDPRLHGISCIDKQVRFQYINHIVRTRFIGVRTGPRGKKIFRTHMIFCYLLCEIILWEQSRDDYRPVIIVFKCVTCCDKEHGH